MDRSEFNILLNIVRMGLDSTPPEARIYNFLPRDPFKEVKPNQLKAFQVGSVEHLSLPNIPEQSYFEKIVGEMDISKPASKPLASKGGLAGARAKKVESSKEEPLKTKTPYSLSEFYYDKNKSDPGSKRGNGVIIIEVSWNLLKLMNENVFKSFTVDPNKPAEYIPSYGTPIHLALDLVAWEVDDIKNKLNLSVAVGNRIVIVADNQLPIRMSPSNSAPSPLGSGSLEKRHGLGSPNNLDQWSRLVIAVHEMTHKSQEDTNPGIGYNPGEVQADYEAVEYLKKSGLSIDHASEVMRYFSLMPVFGSTFANQIKHNSYLDTLLSVYSKGDSPKSQQEAVRNKIYFKESNLKVTGRTADSSDPKIDTSSQLKTIKDVILRLGLQDRVKYGDRFTLPGVSGSLTSVFSIIPVPLRESFDRSSNSYTTTSEGTQALYLWSSPVLSLMWVHLPIPSIVSNNPNGVWKLDETDTNELIYRFESMYRGVVSARRRRA